ncbi:MAG: hypothetical protein Ct9H300mP28_13540 [Pseudomonadota bacterium]|nr:MAG: hypothetical protein Ct9H300mP28_13540 [Pseudomonadota bacterium]
MVQKSPEQGYTNAQLSLGEIYKNGKVFLKIIRRHFTGTKRWQKRVTPVHSTISVLCMNMEKGRGKDYTQAFNGIKKRRTGRYPSQLNLALMYKYGTGVSEDYSQAVFWYKKAAEQGNTKAQVNLATMYNAGEGVPEIIFWPKVVESCSSTGSEQARDLKNELRKRMTREQIAKAQQLSIDWEQSVSSQ